MATPTTTRTFGPLHFEDLEPHRFEDLVRQLAYDFRPWRQLEATGRSGSDDGFDVRGIESPSHDETILSSDDDEEENGEAITDERVWLIQCKREKSITPKKLGGYLDDLPADENNQLYGLIFAAASDFSKQARDLFRMKTREMGVAEAYLWGKAEIEDMLFQPKNDALLFSYFGISLRVRQRSLRTEIRSQLATKRKAAKVLEHPGIEFLVRDADDERYPYLDDNEDKERFDRGRWCVYVFEECRHDGIHVLFQRQFAFLDDDCAKWDCAEKMNDARRPNNPWTTEEDRRREQDREAARRVALSIWDQLPENNRGWLTSFLILPYEHILAIDETGDEIFEGPHIYTTPFTRSHGPFRPHTRVELVAGGQWSPRYGNPAKETRIEVFPRDTGD